MNARDVLAATVSRLDVETAWLPRIRVDQPFAPSSSTGVVSSGLTKILRPKFTVTLSDGTPLSVAPAGAPGASKWPWLAVLAAIGLLVVVVVIVRRVRA